MASTLPRKCEKLRERLAEYADGTLAGRSRARVERHLATCQRCSAELADLRTVIQAVRAIGPEPASEALMERVRATAPQPAPPGPVPGQLWARLLVPVALVAGMVVVAFALRGTAPRERGIPQAAAPAAAGRGASPSAERAVSVPHEPISVAQSPPAASAERPATGRGTPGPPGAEALESAPPTTARHLGGSAGAHARAGASAPEALAVPGPAGPAGPPGGTDQTAPPQAMKAEGMGGGRGAGMRGDRMMAAPKREAPLAGTEGAPPLAARAGGGESAAAHAARPPRSAEQDRLLTVAEPPAPAPVAAQVILVGPPGRQQIALRLTAAGPVKDVAVRLSGRAGRRVLWEGPPGGAAVVVPSASIGAGPASVSVSIESSSGRREYVLFAPTMERLGQTAATAPVGRYAREPLSKVLADFSALTGFVILAEAPLDRPVEGVLPPGDPATVLRSVAASADMDIAGLGAARTLTHRR